MSDLPEYKFDRAFDAPVAMVWKAWTDPELLARWYGPGVETIIHEFDLRPGGVWLNEMKWGDKSMCSKMAFLEVVPQQKMVWHHYGSTDSDWNSAPNPMMPNWPRILLTTVTFVEADGKTTVSLSQIPHEASAEEIECFAGAMAGMDNGWGSGYKILDDIFTELQA